MNPVAQYPWEKLSDEELLSHRICDLKLTLEGSTIEDRVDRFYDELEQKGLRFRPPCYLTTEWLCPDRVPTIGIPFCLSHPRLNRLEQTMMLEVEGNSEREFMKLLRHEAGHAFNYAYMLYRRSRWRDLFGPISQEYNVQDYYVRPYSRQYVEHLPDNYAQAHPDEDFAETFAVWLTPGLDWKKKYGGWRALKKLEYVDHLMREVGDTTPIVSGGQKLWPVARVRSTLQTYYKKKRSEFGDSYPAFYDQELLTLFTREENDFDLAADFLTRNHRMLINHIARWAHVRKYAVHDLLKKMIRRTRDLSLHIRAEEANALLPVTTRLTAILLEDRFRTRQADDEGNGA